MKKMTCEHISSSLIFYNETQLQQTANLLQAKNEVVVRAFAEVEAQAKQALSQPLNPVTNKTILPPSGDIHDYYSIAPYFWPDPSKPEGLPWMRKDGEINPLTRGDDSDFSRLHEMFAAIKAFSMTYYFSGEIAYANKAKELLLTWFVTPETKVNPNTNFGQGVPGEIDGRPFGIIEWESLRHVITMIQLLVRDDLLTTAETDALHAWLWQYLQWLQHSPLGQMEQTRENNHGTMYDVLCIGLMLYLGDVAGATAALVLAQTRRIATQIQPDGSMPRELARTKSVSYSTMNLEGMLELAEYAKRFTTLDVWGYESEQGASIATALDFLRPYCEGKKDWTWEQITKDGAQAVFAERTQLVFARAQLLFDAQPLCTKEQSCCHHCDPYVILRYAFG